MTTHLAIAKNSTPEDDQLETFQEVNNEEEISHEVTLFAEPVFHIGSFNVTNSLINTWLVVIFFIIFSLIFRKRISKIPKGVQNWAERIVEAALDLADSVTHDRKKSERFFPLVFGLFLFILVNNWFGLIPGVGSIGMLQEHDGAQVFVPFFRGGTADLNTTLALAIFSILLTHLAGIFFVGTWRYINRYININALLEIPKKILKEPSIIFVNPIKFFVGIVEVIGEVSKTASLALRLFGNIFAGEVLLVSISSLFAFFAPVPFLYLELFVGALQAVVFSILVLVFFTIATTEEEH